jgi:hypothetical protein
MKNDDIFILILILLFLLGILLTLVCGPKKSRHGYGSAGFGQGRST